MTAAAWLFGAGGVVLAGIGAFFIALRPAFLPEDLRFLDRTAAQIEEAIPTLGRWLRRVFTVFGGHALTAGILTVYVAATGVRDGETVAVVALAATGATSMGLMAAVNFAIRSAFRWLLLAAFGLWVAATAAAVWS
jgi:hypothetical protein